MHSFIHSAHQAAPHITMTRTATLLHGSILYLQTSLQLLQERLHSGICLSVLQGCPQAASCLVILPQQNPALRRCHTQLSIKQHAITGI